VRAITASRSRSKAQLSAFAARDGEEDGELHVSGGAGEVYADPGHHQERHHAWLRERDVVRDRPGRIADA
jgi:hypothetical protein